MSKKEKSIKDKKTELEGQKTLLTNDNAAKEKQTGQIYDQNVALDKEIVGL